MRAARKPPARKAVRPRRLAEARRWADENREATKTCNERVEREGLWHKGLTKWH